MPTCADENGVGIAASQVSNSQQIFIIASQPNVHYPYTPEMEWQRIIADRKP